MNNSVRAAMVSLSFLGCAATTPNPEIPVDRAKQHETDETKHQRLNPLQEEVVQQIRQLNNIALVDRRNAELSFEFPNTAKNCETMPTIATCKADTRKRMSEIVESHHMPHKNTVEGYAPEPRFFLNQQGKPVHISLNDSSKFLGSIAPVRLVSAHSILGADGYDLIDWFNAKQAKFGPSFSDSTFRYMQEVLKERDTWMTCALAFNECLGNNKSSEKCTSQEVQKLERNP